MWNSDLTRCLINCLFFVAIIAFSFVAEMIKAVHSYSVYRGLVLNHKLEQPSPENEKVIVRSIRTVGAGDVYNERISYAAGAGILYNIASYAIARRRNSRRPGSSAL